MKKQLTRISPLRAGIVLGILYGALGLVFAAVFMIGAIFGAKPEGAPAVFGGDFWDVLFPLIYAVGGFICGVIVAAIYNLVAKWTGGLEFEVRDISPTV